MEVTDLCGDCPPVGYPTDKTRCVPCPRRPMTPAQIELARHALGLNRVMVSYRNHFVAGPGHDDFADWEAMVAAGFATRRTSKVLPAGEVMFHLTRAGAEAALRPGEHLDPEDWPNCPQEPQARRVPV